MENPLVPTTYAMDPEHQAIRTVLVSVRSVVVSGERYGLPPAAGMNLGRPLGCGRAAVKSPARVQRRAQRVTYHVLWVRKSWDQHLTYCVSIPGLAYHWFVSYPLVKHEYPSSLLLRGDTVKGSDFVSLEGLGQSRKAPMATDPTRARRRRVIT